VLLKKLFKNPTLLPTEEGKVRVTASRTANADPLTYKKVASKQTQIIRTTRFAISSPISMDAVAAGDGALQTFSIAGPETK
jgi:hypothetical protein